MTLPTLLDRVGMTKLNRRMWFSNAELVGRQLRVSDIDDFGCIERCWLETLRGPMPDLECVFVPQRQSVSR